jgi:GNAT superfamily N-acetyltransferase
MIRQLPDGTCVTVRPIRPDDKALLVNGLEELSELSVHRRFLSPKPSFTKAELRYLTEVDGNDHVAFVAQRPGDYTRMLGVGRWVRLAEDREAAEAAIVVADDWHGRGVGTLLSHELADAARERGIRRFTATMLADNAPAQRLMEKLTRRLDRRSGGQGVSELVVDLAA